MIVSKLSRITFFTGLFLLPLLFVPSFVNGFEGTKIWFFQRWVLVLAILCGWQVVRGQEASGNKKMVVLIFIYFFWNFLISVFGINPLNSFYGLFWREEGIVTLACYVALVWVICSIFKKRDRKLLAEVLICSGFSVSLFVLFSVVANYFWNFPTYKYLERHVGTFGNPNFLAGFLVICLPFIFVVKNLWVRIIVSTVTLVAIYLSNSRGAFLALGLTSAVFVWLWIFKKQKRMGIAIGLLAVIIFVFWFYSWVTFVPRTDPVFAASRQRMWVRGSVAFLNRPINGYGLENFSLAISKITYPKKIDSHGEVYVDKAHNETLEILVASGIPGFSLWVLIFLFACRNYYKKKQFLFLAALLIFFFKSQTNIVSVSEYTLFWVLVGFSAV